MRARDTPNAVALVFGSTRVSYADLNRSANRFARRLRAVGAKRGKRVGICLERSPEMVIAMLAVLKSGAAYVPLDPTYPQARLRTMLEDADSVVLVTTERISAELPPHAARPLYIDQEPAAAGAADDNPGIPVGAEDIAYVIYTSGSTGRPKGVLVTHGGVSNQLAWRSSYFPVEPSDQFLQSASLSFDDSVWEILEPLSAGACLVLTRPRFEYDSAYLVKLMVEQRITARLFRPLPASSSHRGTGYRQLRLAAAPGDRWRIACPSRCSVAYASGFLRQHSTTGMELPKQQSPRCTGDAPTSLVNLQFQ